MNARQAAKAAAERIEELEHFNKLSAATVKGLYDTIEFVIKGGNVCERCEDFEECQLQAKGKGCEDFLLKEITEGNATTVITAEGVKDEGTGIFGTGAEG